jgi:hypothetical protein
MNRLALTLALAVAALGCASDKQDPAAPKTSLATASAGNVTVELLTDTQLETGLTPIYLKVTTATGQVVTDAAVTFMPVMSMTGGTTHGAPMMGPPTLGADGLYRCDVVFQMATSAMGSWSATVGVTPAGSSAVEASFPSLTVVDSGRARTFSSTDPVTSAVTKYVASLAFEAAPRVGLNPVLLTLHRMQDMMTFVPVDDATFVLDPQMPSMGHGSPGSVNPTLASPGLYAGQLSFSMAGAWVTTVTVSRGGVTVGAPTFATTF